MNKNNYAKYNAFKKAAIKALENDAHNSSFLLIEINHFKGTIEVLPHVAIKKSKPKKS